MPQDSEIDPSISDSNPTFMDKMKELLGGRSQDTSLKESLEEVFEEMGDTDLTMGAEERSIIKNTLTFGETRVDSVMVPRTDIVAINCDADFNELISLFIKAQTSRLPIYRETLDEVIAMVHIKDVFRTIAERKDRLDHLSIRSIQRPILFVPPSMRLMDLLTKMQTTHIHMAMVVDEYGGTDGLLTIEDLVEQIVGDIEDEHDDSGEEMLIELPNGDLRLDARLPIDDLENILGIDFLSDDQDDDVDTVGGLVFTIAGHIPSVGEMVTYRDKIVFEVLDGDARRIRSLLLRRSSDKKS